MFSAFHNYTGHCLFSGIAFSLLDALQGTSKHSQKWKNITKNWSNNILSSLRGGQIMFRWTGECQVDVRWTTGKRQVKFKILKLRLGKVIYWSVEGRMMVRWSSGDSQVRVKSQEYSELDIVGHETCIFL